MQMYELFSQRNKFDLKRFIPCHFHNFFFAIPGACYIGSKNLITLWYLVLLPYFLYFFTGALVLTCGWIWVLKRPKLAPLPPAAAPLTHGPPRKERDLLGALTTLYALPIFLVMISYFMEYSNRYFWWSYGQLYRFIVEQAQA